MTNTDKQLRKEFESIFPELFDRAEDRNVAFDWILFKLRHVAESEYKRGVEECIEETKKEADRCKLSLMKEDKTDEEIGQYWAQVSVCEVLYMSRFKSLLTPSQKEE